MIRELGTLFHPYDLEHGRVQPVAQVAARFADVWARLARLAAAADLPTRGREHLAKAQRLTVQWLATLTSFVATVQSRVEALDLAPDMEQTVLTQLIPALYLQRVAGRSHADTRYRLAAPSAQLLEPLRQPAHPLQALRLRFVPGSRPSPPAARTYSSAAAPVWKAAMATCRSIITVATVSVTASWQP